MSGGSGPAEIERGTLTFTVESRVLRELGERLVRKPEVALIELVKNAYDADSTTCRVEYRFDTGITVSDDGHGMTLGEFRGGWMRIGTSSKEGAPRSRAFGRTITGEKGIGRFAVRFLGRRLHLETVAYDQDLRALTKLTADFDWPDFDRNEDLGAVRVPYTLARADRGAIPGTRLEISGLRSESSAVKWDAVRTSSIGVLSPYRSLLRHSPTGVDLGGRTGVPVADPGFTLRIEGADGEDGEQDVAEAVLDSYVLKAVLVVAGDGLKLRVYRKGESSPRVEISDEFKGALGRVYADIRFFPRRKGTFATVPVDGRTAMSWVAKNSGVAVFDRSFRVSPYGEEDDDWLFLASDSAKRSRTPRSSLADKHFPMDEPTRQSTQLNYMLRLPYPRQLVGIVQVEGQRGLAASEVAEGLVPAADREGFVLNRAYFQLVDVIRGAVEVIAFADRELQQDEQRAEQAALLSALERETLEAIRDVRANPNIADAEKDRIVGTLSRSFALAQEHDSSVRQREEALTTMSLLGIVAGFMTHEFGAALAELEEAMDELELVQGSSGLCSEVSDSIRSRIGRLREFLAYSQGYIRGASAKLTESYPARPRIQQVVRVFGKYAEERGIVVDVDVERELDAPRVPVSLYSGIVLNLYTNALKAITARIGDADRRIAFRAWNEKGEHYLEVSDTGIGIPTSMRRRVFEPLFTTTDSNSDPLGSGMGLGLSLLKRGVETFGGRVSVVDPPPDFVTCFRVQLPLEAAVDDGQHLAY